MPNESAAVVALPTYAPSPEVQAFDLLQRQGKMLAASAIVPDTYRGKVADCALIYEIASRVRASPVLVANNLDLIHGRPSWRAQFLIACVNQSGRFTALRYEYEGEGKARKCRAWARELATQDRLDGTWIDWKMVDAEGWSKKAGSKWNTMPDQMFAYRAAAFWTRMYAPEIALGFPTDDEVRDVIDVTPIAPGRSGTLAEINQAIAGEPAPAVDPLPAIEAKPEPMFTIGDVKASIERARSIDELDEAAALLDSIQNADDREAGRALYHKRREALLQDDGK